MPTVLSPRLGISALSCSIGADSYNQVFGGASGTQDQNMSIGMNTGTGAVTLDIGGGADTVSVGVGADEIVIGSALGGKMAFFGETAVSQPGAITPMTPSDLTGANTVSKANATADILALKNNVQSIVTALTNLGLLHA